MMTAQEVDDLAKAITELRPIRLYNEDGNRLTPEQAQWVARRIALNSAVGTFSTSTEGR